jgi:carbon-monoxide dehydrogenase medium subunit
MKPPIFGYERAGSIVEASEMLHAHGEDARVLAGGQSLIASLNFRLSAPTALIDITQIDALKGITAHDHGLSIGALTSHTDILTSADISRWAPLMHAAGPHIAHAAIRNRGTLGGSIAFADPAAEWPACALALDASIVVANAAGTRQVPATSFFRDLYDTALDHGEVVKAIEIPSRPAGERHAFRELARRHGDYAIVGLAALGQWRDGRLAAPRLAFFGVGATPVLATHAMQALDGTAGEQRDIEAAGEALAADLDPFDDLHASAEMRRHLARTLMARCVEDLRSSPEARNG